MAAGVMRRCYNDAVIKGSIAEQQASFREVPFVPLWIIEPISLSSRSLHLEGEEKETKRDRSQAADDPSRK